MIKRIHSEHKCCLVFIDTAVGEGLEYLLKRCLENRVLTNVQLFLVVFNLPEHITDCLTLFRKSQVEKLRTLLHQLNLAEQLREQSNYLKAVLLNVDVGC